jgi:hypothetical protein
MNYAHDRGLSAAHFPPAHERQMPRGAAHAVKPGKRAAPPRFALTVTAPLSVAGCRGRDEGRPG